MNRRILEQAELRALLKAFKGKNTEKYNLLALGYFGSYARGEANEDSDIDIVFNTDTPNLFKTATMKQLHKPLQTWYILIDGDGVRRQWPLCGMMTPTTFQGTIVYRRLLTPCKNYLCSQ